MKFLHHNQHLNYNNKEALAPEVIRQLASTLGKSQAYRNGYMCCCPAHEDINPSLFIWPSSQYPLGLKCFANCNPRDIYNEIKAKGLLSHCVGSLRPQNSHASTKFNREPGNILAPIKSSDNQDNQKFAKKLWERSLDPTNTLVETYLEARGIHGNIPPTIRYVPAARYCTNTYWPCMVAAITRWPDPQLVAIHRTFLSLDGKSKAPAEDNKKMLGQMSGGAVRLTLTQMCDRLMVGEGIETMLSLMGLYPEYAIWAVLSASNFENLILPELPLASTILIAADHDANNKGLNSAESAAKKWRLQGRKVRIAFPPEKDTDFNDVLRGKLS